MAALAAMPCGCRAPTAPAADGARGADCADVETLRVCWGGDGARVVRRPVPAAPPAGASPMGWRCAGSGAARRCALRDAGAPPFTCAGARCTQRHPRMPDDGEWQCADSAGATVCLGGERAAGVAAAPADAGWFCGARRGGPPGARVCVDLSPDFPDGHGRGWRCRTLYDGPTRRVCDRAPDAHALADPCDPAHPCVDGSRCADGRCVPDRPAPACWLDGDCPGGRCRFGSCLGGGA
ncbi:MAG TPA: hypothetical protein VIF57_21550 [Polyangia bacterium]